MDDVRREIKKAIVGAVGRVREEEEAARPSDREISIRRAYLRGLYASLRIVREETHLRAS